MPLCSSEEVLAHLAPLCLLLVIDRVSEVITSLSDGDFCTMNGNLGSPHCSKGDRLAACPSFQSRRSWGEHNQLLILV